MEPQEIKEESKSWDVVFGIIAFAVGVLFALVSCAVTSPMYGPYTDNNSAFFTTMGRAIIAGRRMYRDYYDTTGPVFFMWQAMGQLIVKGRTGAFILNALSHGLTALLIYGLCKKSGLQTRWMMIVFAVSGFFVFCNMDAGNTPGEFCALLIMLCVYKGYSLYITKEGTTGFALTAGAVTSLCFFSTVIAAVPALLVAIVTLSAVRKEIKEAIKAYAYYVTAAAAVAMVVVGVHTALGTAGDMLKWSVRYAVGSGFSSTDVLILLPVIVFLCVYTGSCVSRKEKKIAPVVAGLVTATVVIFSALSFRTVFDRDFGIILNEVGQARYVQAMNALSVIPDDERDSILCLHPGMRFFEYTGLFPAGNYPYETERDFVLDPGIRTRIIEEVNSGSHKWLLYDLTEEKGDEQLFSVIREKYEVVTIQGIHLLARLKEQD